jgi:predicted dinucleotide-binding enzyme
MAVAAIELELGVADTTETAVDDLRLGIVGAGKFGTTLARAAVAAGYDVAIAGSGPADDIALTVDVLAPGAHAATTNEVVRHSDIIVLAVPTHRFRELPQDLFAGKIIIDAMNYWQPVDGDDAELTTAPDGTSRVVQERFPTARVVKSLNQLGYHQLEEHRRPKGAPDRIALGGRRRPPRRPQGHATPRPTRLRLRRRRTIEQRHSPGTRRVTHRHHLQRTRTFEAPRSLTEPNRRCGAGAGMAAPAGVSSA